MGGGIAQALLHKDMPVHIKDVDEAVLEATKNRIEKLFAGAVKKVCYNFKY